MKTAKFLVVSLLALPLLANAANVERGIKFGYAPNSSSDISGKHLNLYNPFDPSTYRIETTNVEDGRIDDIFSLGYVYKRIQESSPIGLDVGFSVNQGYVSPQTIRLVSQEGSFNVASDQPQAEIRYFELYVGGTYAFSDTETGPYVGAGVSLVKGKAYKTFYNLQDLLTGVGSYGQSGSSNMDGHAISVKVGMKYSGFSVELEHGMYDLHVDSFRSFEINGADLEFDKTMLSIILSL